MEFKEIQEQFNSVIRYSQGIENPQTDKLFEDWLEAKRDFIELLDGKLIFEWPEKVSFELGRKEKILRVTDFADLVENKYSNSELADFVFNQKEGFFSNTVIKENLAPNGEKIPKGMKLLRAFKFFEKDKKVLNDLQSAASMIIQEDKIEGTLCFSVHPLDFLSASENNHNWRSCHALDGDYRAGNLSYMVDKTTVICYLKSNKMEKLPNFPEDVLWNSKKWRVWLFFSNNWDMMFAGRQYPFYTETGINFIKDRVLPVLNLGPWSPWQQKKIASVEENGIFSQFKSPYVPIKNVLIPMNELVKNGEGSLHFNDLLSSSCYDPYYSYKLDTSLSHLFVWNENICIPKTSVASRFLLGGKCNCLRCGEKSIDLTETMMCTDCELEYGESDSDVFATCPCCGSRFVFDDGYWIEGAQETICESCVDNYTEVCEHCGDRFYKEDMVYSRKYETSFCRWCYNDVVRE